MQLLPIYLFCIMIGTAGRELFVKLFGIIGRVEEVFKIVESNGQHLVLLFRRLCPAQAGGQ